MDFTATHRLHAAIVRPGFAAALAKASAPAPSRSAVHQTHPTPHARPPIGVYVFHWICAEFGCMFDFERWLIQSGCIPPNQASAGSSILRGRPPLRPFSADVIRFLSVLLFPPRVAKRVDTN